MFEILTFEFHDLYEIKIKIDPTIFNDARATEYLKFWYGKKDIDDRPQIQFLKILCGVIFENQERYMINTDGIIKLFNDGLEGFPPIDGSEGILLLEMDELNLFDAENIILVTQKTDYEPIN